MNNGKRKCIKCGKDIDAIKCANCGFDVTKNTLLLLWKPDIPSYLYKYENKVLQKTSFIHNEAIDQEYIETRKNGSYKINVDRIANTFLKRTWRIEGETLHISPFNGQLSVVKEQLSRETTMIWKKAKKLIIEEGITELASWEFYDLNIDTVIFPKSLKKIGFECFKYCNKIISADLPEKLETISGGAFDGCVNLMDIQIPKSVKYIGNYAFRRTKYDNAKKLGHNETAKNSVGKALGANTSASVIYPTYEQLNSNPQSLVNDYAGINDSYGMHKVKFDLPGYIGNVVEGKRNADIGFLFYQNRNLQYCGGFKDNMKNGFGITFDQYGYIEYAGYWKDDKKNGMGYLSNRKQFVAYSFENGINYKYRIRYPASFDAFSYNSQNNEFTPKFVGSIINGKREGFGVLISNGYIVYIGMWHNDKFSGNGRIMNYETSYSDGSFENGLRNGMFKTTFYKEQGRNKQIELLQFFKDGAQTRNN